MTLTPFKQLILLSSLSLSVALPVFASDHLSTTQRTEIKSLIHDYLVDDNPEVLLAMSKSLRQREEQSIQTQMRQVIARQRSNLFYDKNSPTLGRRNAPVKIVEFFDYQCHHCKVASNNVSDILKTNKNIRVIFKEFPIFGKDSTYAALAALAADKQGKYFAMHSELMSATERPLSKTAVKRAAKRAGVNFKQLERDMKSRSVRQQISDNRSLARVMGFSYTPVFIVSNAKTEQAKTYFLPGAVPKATLEAHIRRAQN